jgi:UPF0755 protein
MRATDEGAVIGGGTLSSRTTRATRKAAGTSAARRRSHGPRAQEAQATLGVDGSYRRGKRREHNWIGPVITLLVFVALGFGVYKFVWPRLFGIERDTGSVIAAGQQVKITIAEGSGAGVIAQQLAEAGVIDDATAFAQQLMKEGADSKLKPGTYLFVTGSSYRNVIDLLVGGPNSSEYGFTIPEGRDIQTTASIIEEALGIPAETFLERAKASNFVEDYPFLEEAAQSEADSLEGFLFPKTYSLDGQEITADNAIRAMLNQYQREIAAFDFDAARATVEEEYGVSMSEYDFVKLASIVEREALVDEQRGRVASVFYNRLEQGKYLESDATIAYVTGGTDPAADRNVESPYNSYMNAGLPPTPICSPSLESLRAALEPEDTNYLYFWILENDEHFSETFEEHQNTYNSAIRG